MRTSLLSCCLRLSCVIAFIGLGVIATFFIYCTTEWLPFFFLTTFFFGGEFSFSNSVLSYSYLSLSRANSCCLALTISSTFYPKCPSKKYNPLFLNLRSFKSLTYDIIIFSFMKSLRITCPVQMKHYSILMIIFSLLL